MGAHESSCRSARLQPARNTRRAPKLSQRAISVLDLSKMLSEPEPESDRLSLSRMARRALPGAASFLVRLEGKRRVP